jgi:hypothetical protein
MADIKITDLAAYTNPVSTDVLPIVDLGSDLTKKVSIADLLLEQLVVVLMLLLFLIITVTVTSQIQEIIITLLMLNH